MSVILRFTSRVYLLSRGGVLDLRLDVDDDEFSWWVCSSFFLGLIGSLPSFPSGEMHFFTFNLMFESRRLSFSMGGCFRNFYIICISHLVIILPSVCFMFMHLFVIWCYLQNCKNKTKRLKGDEPEPIVVNIGYKIIKQKPKPKRKMFILENK